MNYVQKIRFWSFKVLPLVYDDSLSYYEVLCKLTQRLNQVIDNVNELEPLINEMQETLAQIQADRETVMKDIQAMLAQMQAQVNAMLAQANAEIDASIAEMEKHVEAELMKYQRLLILLEQQVSDFEVYLKTYYDQGLLEQWTKLKGYIDEKFQSTEIWNPVYGRMEPNQKAMQNTYDFAGWAIPEPWLTAVGITAQELEELKIPAGEWDTKARVYLWFWWHRKNHTWEMTNPWSGHMDDPRHVLITLIGMHQEGVTAQELEDANIPVEAYDNAEFTAYDHDWTRGWFEELKAMYA